ncbi:hypothetical protein IWQ60_006906 [Tieghemiomyces parasiticus]|uniref:Vacuolar membrane protein n=1 Tax=Tieghemiomyces parasiticus TaxID=78921 RepID=A0A9W8DQV8_9FUNG|nr:hypothetical protein IWQ60_006906 [Tieghemiomyces parasiticus]
MTSLPEENCKLMDSFAIFIQSLLGVLAISTLFIKRQREVPQRPFRIWLYDVSKQATGSAMVHMLNLVAAYLSGKSSHEDSNPCVWYFMNLVLDTTIGVYILYLYLHLLHAGVRRLGLEHMESGNYGTPPRAANWVKQSAVFFVALLSMKVTVMIALAVFPALAVLGRIFLAPFQHMGDPRLQVVMVMLVVPLVMNIIQFWLIDHVIKQKPAAKYCIPDHPEPADEDDTLYSVVTDEPGRHSLDDDTSSPDSAAGLLAHRSAAHFDHHARASRTLSRQGSGDDVRANRHSRYEMDRSPIRI